MQVHRLTTLAESTEILDSWNRLARGVPFRLPDWLLPWWEHYGERRELLVLCVHNEQSEVVGIAPWYVEHSAVDGLAIRQLGTGEMCSDYLGILSRPGTEDQVAVALADYLARPPEDLAWHVLELAGVDADELTTLRLVERLAQQGSPVHRYAADRCWRIALPPSWEEYLQRHSKSHRKQLRRLVNRMLQTQQTTLRLVQSPEELAPAWEQLIDLHQRRRQSLGEPGCFASAPFARCHEEIARRMLAAGRLRLLLLDIGGHTVAAEYQLAGDGITYAYQAGVDPDYLEQQPGKLITIASLRQAIDEGQHSFDLLRGDEPYKPHWRAEPRQMYDFRIAAHHAGARFRHTAWLARRRMKSWLKRNLPRASGAEAGA